MATIKILTAHMGHYRSIPSNECSEGWTTENPNRTVERDLECAMRKTVSVVSGQPLAEVKKKFDFSLHQNASESKFICRYIGEDDLKEVIDPGELKVILRGSEKLLIEWSTNTKEDIKPDVKIGNTDSVVYDTKTCSVIVPDARIVDVAESLGKVIHSMGKDKTEQFRGSYINVQRCKISLTIALPEKITETFQDLGDQLTISGRISSADVDKKSVVIRSDSGKHKGQNYTVSYSGCEHEEDTRKIVTSTLDREGTLWVTGCPIYKFSIRGKKWTGKLSALRVDNDYTRLRPAK